ncbi:hypothetical protein [Pendulispora albinea]|uniref:Tetratricopeptide repeat protein n=1 Tax=Pendulispora albinea TaxID=2741071 RepID=A0ABZ2LRD6_9BACT
MALPRTAHAQHAPTRGEVDADSDAELRYKEGMEAARTGNARLARVKFLQAYAASPQTRYLWNLAIAELDANRRVEAAEHLRLYMADPRTDAPSKAQARELIAAELWSGLGHLKVEAPRGTLVRLDGRKQIVPNEIVDVEPGVHTVEDGHGKRHEANIPAGQQVVMSFNRDEVPPMVAPPRSPEPASQSTWWTAGRYVGGGLMVAGVATAIAAVGFTVAANSSSDKAAEQRAASDPSACWDVSSAACSALKSDADAWVRNSNIARGLWIGAGAALVGGATLLIVARPKTPQSTQAIILPAVGKEAASVHVHLRF